MKVRRCAVWTRLLLGFSDHFGPRGSADESSLICHSSSSFSSKCLGPITAEQQLPFELIMWHSWILAQKLQWPLQCNNLLNPGTHQLLFNDFFFFSFCAIMNVFVASGKACECNGYPGLPLVFLCVYSPICNFRTFLHTYPGIFLILHYILLLLEVKVSLWRMNQSEVSVCSGDAGAVN